MKRSRRDALALLGAAGWSSFAPSYAQEPANPLPHALAPVPSPYPPASEIPPEAELPLRNPLPSSPPAPHLLVPPPLDSNRGVQGRMTGAQAAVAALQCQRVRCVFGIPGAQNNEFWDAMKSAGLPYLLVSHEASASVMADAAARVSGEVGVCALIPGPGLTNALTGIGEALLDSSPIVVLLTDITRGPDAPVAQVHGLANPAILRPVVKDLYQVHHVGQIPAALFQAFRLARAGEPGPVGVVVPYPRWFESWDFNDHVPLELAPPWDEAAYLRARCILAQPHRKIGIYAGIGCAEAAPALQAAAEMLQAPVATSVSGKGALSDQHPLAVGWGYGPQANPAAEAVFRDLDTVLAIGVKFSEVSTAGYAIPQHHTIIHVDANPRNLGRNAPTAVAVPADARLFLDRLLADRAHLARPANPALARSIARKREKDRRDAAVARTRGGTDPMTLLHQLRCALPPHAWFFIDVTASVHWASQTIEVNAPRHYFSPTNNQSMGWAIPAAIGAQRLAPNHPVACVTGDGCFLMAAMELTTAARMNLPVKVFVLDDGAYHYMQMLQEPSFGRTTATQLAHLDYAAFARACGLAYLCIPSSDHIPRGVHSALHTPGPVLVQVKISYDGRPIRWLQALRSSYLDRLSTSEKTRLAARAITRAPNPLLQND